MFEIKIYTGYINRLKTAIIKHSHKILRETPLN